LTDIVDAQERLRSLKTVSTISYLLHLIVAVGAVIPGGQPSALLLIIAFIIDIVKRDDALGTWMESHFLWRIRTVLWAMGLYLVTAPLWVFFLAPGWIAWTAISVWFLYRVVRGWVNLNAEKPIEMS
jgi:uncharacterized membrane protein